uniref:RNA polymerase sigma factor n=1 Tax=Acetatifactor sp. TaxID=1872090 RepID=UPI004055C553
MDDKAIVELYFARSEKAISETANKYGGYCYSIANNILSNKEDSEESVNDTYLAAWNNMPPRHPSVLATFLGKITRYISLDRWKSRSAYKRGGGEVTLALEELDEFLSSGESTEEVVEKKELIRSINR